MFYTKVLSQFNTESGLDFEVFEELLDPSGAYIEVLSDLNVQNLNILFKLLIDHGQFKSLGKLIHHFDSKSIDYNPSLLALALFKNGNLKSNEDFQKAHNLIKKLSGPTAISLLPFIKSFPEKVQKEIEASLIKRRGDIQIFREDLKEQIEFLKTQMLHEKALETEELLKFHFPEIKEQFLSAKQTQSKSEEQKLAKVIERNLSFGLNTESKSETSLPSYEKNQDEERKASLELAKLWFSKMKGESLDLLLTQLEFLNFENPDFYLEVLKEVPESKVWTKISLFLKSQNYLEGLEFLDQNESILLTDSPETVYNYYYTKGLLLLGAGMNKEAEEIFLLIKEQKENFRDIQSLLQNAK